MFTFSDFLLLEVEKNGLTSRLVYKLPGPAFTALDCVKRVGTADTGGVVTGVRDDFGREDPEVSDRAMEPDRKADKPGRLLPTLPKGI